MKAAVVTSFDAPPQYREFPDPVRRGPHDRVVRVLAAGLHPRVRSQADGSHYTSVSADALPFVPGVDGVARDADGWMRYFVLPDESVGSMAEQTVIDERRSVLLDDEADPVAIAAAMNPAMSSWIALRLRASFTTGQKVLVVGAAGNAGRMAVQVARLLGASAVVAVARNADRSRHALIEHGATSVVDLADTATLGTVAAEVDVVLDYLWGAPAAAAMTTVVTDRSNRGRHLAWVQIGSVAGAAAPIPSAALRSSNLTIVGSGQGSAGTAQILAELPTLAAHVTAGDLVIDAHAVALADVSTAWNCDNGAGHRVVLIP